MKVQTTCFSTYLITIVFFKSDYAKTTWDIKRIVLLVHQEKKRDLSYRCCFPGLDCNICYSWWKTRPENDGSKASCALALDYCKKKYGIFKCKW